MKIYFFDGSSMKCSSIEFGYERVIVDGYRVVDTSEIVRIVSW